MAKKLAYTVAQIPNRLTGGVVYVPTLRDRGPALPLAEVVRRAIDQNRIAGLKTSAAKAIADGVATQMREEFLDGKTVNFGSYFYARPYLTGKTDENGTLGKENELVVRLFKGKGFELKLSDFELEFIGEAAPKIDFVISDSPNARKGEIVKGKTMLVFGEHLAFDPAKGDTASLRWDDGGEERSAALEVSKSGENLATIDWNAALDAIAPGAPATLALVFHTESGKTFEVSANATVVAG